MNRKILTAVLVTVIAAGAGFIIGKRHVWAAPAPTSDRLCDPAYLARALNLTQDQGNQVRDLLSAYSRDLGQCCSSHCSARMKLGRGMFQPGWDETRDKELVEAMRRAMAETELATIRHIRAVHTLLDAGQKQKFERMVSGCLCEDCTLCETTGDVSGEMESMNHGHE